MPSVWESSSNQREHIHLVARVIIHSTLKITSEETLWRLTWRWWSRTDRFREDFPRQLSKRRNRRGYESRCRFTSFREQRVKILTGNKLVSIASYRRYGCIALFSFIEKLRVIWDDCSWQLLDMLLPRRDFCRGITAVVSSRVADDVALPRAPAITAMKM